MIEQAGSEIGYINVETLAQHEMILNTLLESPIDLIVDCSVKVLGLTFLNKIFTHQKKVKKCFVIVLPVELHNNYPETWDLVPTKKEALDFISFEQIQRDLGF